jgi:hypothetical protein
MVTADGDVGEGQKCHWPKCRGRAWPVCSRTSLSHLRMLLVLPHPSTHHVRKIRIKFCRSAGTHADTIIQLQVPASEMDQQRRRSTPSCTMTDNDSIKLAGGGNLWEAGGFLGWRCLCGLEGRRVALVQQCHGRLPPLTSDVVEIAL